MRSFDVRYADAPMAMCINRPTALASHFVSVASPLRRWLGARQRSSATVTLVWGRYPRSLGHELIVLWPALFHFCMQRGLRVSSTLRALAYSISTSRAASQRSALVNSWVDITAPLATPSQLTTIRTWVTISSSLLRCYWLDESRMRTCSESEELEPLSPWLRLRCAKGLRVRLLSSRFETPSPAIRVL